MADDEAYLSYKLTKWAFGSGELKWRMKPMVVGPLDNSVEPNEPAHPRSQPRYTREEAM